MPNYPLLTSPEQTDLPRLAAAPTAIPSQFADSTHQVFLCDTVDGRMVLKVCDEAAVTKSGFWQGANHLFGLDFPNSLVQIERTHALLAEQGLYAVPEFVASNKHFVLTRFIEGDDISTSVGAGTSSPSQVTDAMVVQLAAHIAKLHQQTQPTWGSLHTPSYQASEWSERLHDALLALAKQSVVSIPDAVLQDALVQAKALQVTEFVPMMLDLRWDQFRAIANKDKTKSGDLALIDLDAFVIAPRALDLVLLTYVLTPEQFTVFKTAYSQQHDWPDYSAQKPCYQLLLFLMQVLGETNLAQWMARI